MDICIKEKGSLSPIFRPRIDALLRDSIVFPLTTVVGGSATGKTTAVLDYARRQSSPVLWHEITGLDNRGAHLWDSVIQTIHQRFPSFGAALSTIPYNPSIALTASFLSAWDEHTQGISDILFVIDNFERVEAPGPLLFMQHLLENRPANLRFIVISRRRNDETLRGGVRMHEALHITGQMLDFTAEEIGELLNARGIFHTQNHITRILSATDGWAFAVTRYVAQMATLTGNAIIDAVFDPSDSFHLFRNEWFDTYSPETRQLLTKLALLPAFSIDLIKALTPKAEAPPFDDLRANLFIRRDPEDQLYRFQALYRRFLRYQATSLSDSQANEIYHIGGDWFMEHQHLPQAIECFGQTRQHESVFHALQKYALPRLDPESIQLVWRLIEDVPASFYQDHPLMYVMLANMKIVAGQLEEASSLLLSIAATYEEMEADETVRQILGEAYLSIGEICLYSTRDDAMHYIKKAHDLLPKGSVFRDERRLLVPNETDVVLRYCKRGTLDMMNAQYEALKGYHDHLYGRYANGFSDLFTTETAFATGDMLTSRAKAYKALQIGRINKRHDVVCNALFLLARTVPLSGNYHSYIELATDMNEYIQQRGLSSLRHCYDYLLGMIYVKLRDFDQVPQRVSDPYAFIEMPQKMLTSREMTIHCAYWVSIGDYHRALVMTDIGQQYARHKHFWISSIYFYILEAICHERLGDDATAAKALHAAYEMAHEDGIIMPFIEAGRFMRTLINTVRHQDRYVFDEAWLSLIYTRANTYAKRVNALMQEHEKQQKGNITVKLSAREQEVLGLLAIGLTRDEISGRLGITIHGVKRHITSLYNKFGATNRVDVIRLAKDSGVIE